VVLKLFHKIKREGTLPDLFYKAKKKRKKEGREGQRKNYKSISLMKINAKITNKILQTDSTTH
jgi:hypothetical protein